MMKSLGERDFSAQETLHHLLSIKLCSSTFKVFTVNLNGSHRIKITQQPEAESVTDDSLVDIYAEREKFLQTHPFIMETNFLQFISRYKVSKNKLEKQMQNMVPRIYPHYSSNPKGKHFGFYCKYQLLLYKPWKKVIMMLGTVLVNLMKCISEHRSNF